MIIAERGFDLRLFPRTFHAEDHKENPPTELVLFRGVVRGVGRRGSQGYANISGIVSKDLKPSNPKALKPLSPQALKPTSPQALKPLSPKALKLSTPQTIKPSNPLAPKPSNS